MALDRFCKKNKIVGAEVSISLPNNIGGLQPTITLTSGYTTTSKTYHVGDPVVNQPAKKMDLFGDGSITKSFTSVIILQLEQEGLLSLNDLITKYLPQYRNTQWQNITIRQLLNMTSGIFNYQENPNFWPQVLANPMKQWAADKLVQYSYTNTKPTSDCPSGGWLCFKPGSNWMYSNTNYILAGMIIKAVTGKSFQNEIDSRLLGATSKLGELKNTYYFSRKKDISSPHFLPEKIWNRMVHTYVPLDPNQPLKDFTDTNLSIAGPSGAGISNSEDLVKWSRLLFQTNKLLSPKEKNRLKSLICFAYICDKSGKNCHKSKYYGQSISHLSAACPQGFGLGVIKTLSPSDGIIWNYSGDILGYKSLYELYKKYNIDIVAQADVSANLYVLNSEILSILKG